MLSMVVVVTAVVCWDCGPCKEQKRDVTERHSHITILTTDEMVPQPPERSSSLSCLGCEAVFLPSLLNRNPK